MLVQQLVALQFRYLRVQNCYSNTLRQAMAQERANPKLPLPFEPDSEYSLESPVFTHFVDNVSSFRLYLHELDRLHSLSNNLPISPDWNDSSLAPALLPKSEQKPQTHRTNTRAFTKRLDEKSLLKLWASTPRETRQTLLAEPTQPQRNMWLSTYGLDEATFLRWVRRHTLGA